MSQTLFVTGRVLHDKDLPSDGRVAMLRLLAFGAGMDDIVLIMHTDRKDHLIMNYAQQVDRLPLKEQENLSLFVSENQKRDTFIRLCFSFPVCKSL